MFSLNKTTSLLNSLLVGSLVALSALQIHNTMMFPVKRGFDAEPHMYYIEYIRTNKSLPTARDGWEMYQAPFYYITASLLPNNESRKYLGLLSYFLLLSASYFTLKKLFRSTTVSLLGIIVIGATPVVVYLTPTISNEFLSAVLVSLATMYYLLHIPLKKTQEKLILGVLLGLAIFTKATALTLLLAVLIDQYLRYKKDLKKLFQQSILPLLTAIAIGGIHYLRNVFLFGNPLITSYNFKNLFPLNQVVLPRDLAFFTSLKGFLQIDLFQSHNYSFLSGTFFSWFYDGHNIIVPVQQFSKSGALLAFAGMPLFLVIAVGFYYSLKEKTLSKLPHIYTMLLFISYILYNFRLPYYSTVKGVFLVSAIFFVGYFVVFFLKKFPQFITVSSIYLICYTIVVLKNFWILSFWYK